MIMKALEETEAAAMGMASAMEPMDGVTADS